MISFSLFINSINSSKDMNSSFSSISFHLSPSFLIVAIFISSLKISSYVCPFTASFFNISFVSGEILLYISCFIIFIKLMIQFFKKPSNYLYVFGRKLIPLKNTIIIGKAFVEVDLQDNIGIEKVEFYIDGELKATMQSTPYSWQWNEAAIESMKLW